MAVASLPQEKSQISEQIAASLNYLYEHAGTPMERAVLHSAYLLCLEKPDLDWYHAADPHLQSVLQVKAIDAEHTLSALLYLQAEALRHKLDVTAYLLAMTTRLWTLAEMIQADQNHPEYRKQ